MKFITFFILCNENIVVSNEFSLIQFMYNINNSIFLETASISLIEGDAQQQGATKAISKINKNRTKKIKRQEK